MVAFAALTDLQDMFQCGVWQLQGQHFQQGQSCIADSAVWCVLCTSEDQGHIHSSEPGNWRPGCYVLNSLQSQRHCVPPMHRSANSFLGQLPSLFSKLKGCWGDACSHYAVSDHTTTTHQCYHVHDHTMTAHQCYRMSDHTKAAHQPYHT